MSDCIGEMLIRNSKEGGAVLVPCGKCPMCRARNISGWSIRLLYEQRASISSFFITLTYDSSHINFERNDGKLSSRPTVRKRCLQLFFKRLRRLHDRRYPNSPRLKYYAVAEYGEKKWRPHYHIILFNAKAELILNAWRDDKGKNIGEVHFGEVNEATCAYTLKYVMKGKRVPAYKNDDRQREFSLISKGIGLSYLTEQKVRWHINDLENRMYVTTRDFKKVSMPRYYKLKIYTDEQRKIAGAAGLQRMQDEKAKEIAKYGERYFTIRRIGLQALAEKHNFNLRKLEKLDL